MNRPLFGATPWAPLDPPDRRWFWLWTVFHTAGLVASLLYPEAVVDWYAGLFAGLEAVGLYAGRPFTRYVHGLIDWARDGDMLTLAASAGLVLVWCATFTVLFRDYGWFSEMWNTALAVGFYIYIFPHFFGRHW